MYGYIRVLTWVYMCNASLYRGYTPQVNKTLITDNSTKQHYTDIYTKKSHTIVSARIEILIMASQTVWGYYINHTRNISS